MNIFQENAKKYFEAGIPVIPLNGKVPLVTGWQEWSLRPQTEDELDVLIDKYPNANIGAVMGQWAIGLDIDTDEPSVIQAVPYSPYRRRGKKGFIALFKPSNLPNNPGREFPVELLGVGRQIVLPPSIHPDTKEPYVWIGEEDVFTHRDFPEITASQIKMVENACKRKGITRKPAPLHQEYGESVCLTDAGRNNRLASIAYAMACDGEEADIITERLLYLDEKENEAPWFSDKSEPHRGKNPKASAYKMAQRAIAKSNKLGHRVEKVDFVFDIKKPDSYTPAPKARGLMGLFQSYCDVVSHGAQDALGLGGSVALMSAICSNRFFSKWGDYNIWPNTYVINLADSGVGKELAQRKIKNLLSSSDLIGSANYKSGSSIIMGLVEQRVRLDIIDECAMLLKAMCSKEDYKSDMVDILSALYSGSDDYFTGFTSKGDGRNFGACWNPCVNILGSTVPAGFRASVSNEMAAKGFMPRCLTFWQKEVGDFKRVIDTKKSNELWSEISRLVRRILNIELNQVVVEGSGPTLLEPEKEEQHRYLPEEVFLSKGASEMLLDLKENYFNEIKNNSESFESAFKNRFAQHVSKLSLLDAVGMGLEEIGVDSIEWAHKVVKWQWETSKELYELANARNETEKNSIEILKFIKKSGVVKKSVVSKRFTHIPKFIRSQVLDTLIESESIEIVEINNSLGRPAKGYRVKT